MRDEPSHMVTIRVVPREQKNKALVPSIVMTEGRGLFIVLFSLWLLILNEKDR